MRFLSTTLFYLLFAGILGCRNHSSDNAKSEIPDLTVPEFVVETNMTKFGSLQPEFKIEPVQNGIRKVSVTVDLKDTLALDDWHITLHPSFKPSFYWAPHLTPTSDHIIAQHVFRAPAMIVTDSSHYLCVIPDLDIVGQSGQPQWYMDLDANANTLTLGISLSQVKEHVLFRRASGQKIGPGTFHFGFYLITSNQTEEIADPWRSPLEFMYTKWFSPLSRQGQPVPGDLKPYVEHAYQWAFKSWDKQVWQEFSVKGRRVGAPVFIVNITQSPNYPGTVNEREFRSVWNQAWFSSLRSASGLYRYARRTNNEEWRKKALMTKELALAFPQSKGLFPSVAGTEMEQVEVNGEKVSRSKGWSTLYFGNSNRNPSKSWGSAKDAPYHILDMSWTAWLMLQWHTELEHDPRLVAYARRYADRLITLQDSVGFFPAWLDQRDLSVLPFLEQSPESSMSVTFLLKMYQVTDDGRYLAAARKCMDAIVEHVVPEHQWEDFETYWSCSRVLDSLVGKKIARNNAFKQNTLSMYWTSEALLNMYEETNDSSYIKVGQRVLDELLMYQATWQPPFIPIRALGGFGVMNGDGEWNDSRQCLFAELLIRYGRELHNREYVDRGVAALKASFVMMYCPENPETKAQWEKVYPFFNEKDYGFMMENYGHGGETNAEGLGIGEFTIYDWGNGAAAEAYNRIVDHFGVSVLEQEGKVANE
ncbi:hypothetical protein WBG78_18450 [Chryseolinea sp. T2]|uniref:hypothetical protein n=1 Tax=Chryseolinea sp. T2 TaxID=3129255 RepID=UPI003077DA90